MEAGCASLAFSEKNPHLLAVGLVDGAVYIYDVRQKTLQPTPVFDSRSLKNAHAEPVWSAAWVDKGEDKGEVLVTASTDGRVLEWTLQKGLEASCLMVLKQLGDAEGVISRTASGLCLDIPGDDPALYLTACEDGTIHKCSDAYAEQYLESYTGHTGPVYKVRSSPYDPKVFLSCSADWTVKLWTQASSSPSASFRSEGSSPLNDVVNDVCWSPRASTQFALVGGDGRVEIWDVAHSLLDPVVREQPSVEPPPSADAPPPTPGTSMESPPEPPAPVSVAATACLFADNAPVLVVGDAVVASAAQVRQFAGGASHKEAAVVRARGGARAGRGPWVPACTSRHRSARHRGVPVRGAARRHLAERRRPASEPAPRV